MTGFDVFALLAILVSCLIGYARGAVREVVTLTAFGLAAVAAIAVLPHFAPLLRHVIHPGWAAAAAAVAIVFVLVYVLVRTGGGALTSHLRRAQLGGVDRTAGAGFGLLRGLIFLGLAALLIDATPWPSGAKPGWISRGLTWPVAHASGRTIAALAPAGGGAAGRFGRFFKDGVTAGFQPSVDEATGGNASDAQSEGGDRGIVLHSSDDAPAHPAHRRHATDGAYGDRSRDGVDRLVERSR